MKLSAIRDVLDCVILSGEEGLAAEVESAIASDGMSVVLATPRPRALLITGLANIQSVRTATVADSAAILYVRGTRPNPAAIDLARSKGLVLLSTRFGMFDACGILRERGLHGVC